MKNNHPTKNTHSDRLERWLGKEKVENISDQFKDYYWPIAIHGVPGNVYVMPGGDFAGEIKSGQFMSSADGAKLTISKIYKQALRKANRNNALSTLIDLIRAEDTRILSVGAFASINQVIEAFTNGKGQQFIFQKSGPTANATGNSNDLFYRASVPAAGSAAGAAPGGTVPNASSTGALGYENLGASNSGHYLNWSVSSSVAANSLLLYDRLFAVSKTMNSTATQAVTGVPSRYQSTVPGSIDYIGGNFCYPANPTTVLPATAHNWTVCQYTDQGGNSANFQSIAGVSACVVAGVDLAVGNWFLPLADGDVGVGALTQMQCSALVATGTIDFVIGHAIAINACPVANMSTLDDGLYSALNLTPILDNACLSFIELLKPGTTSSVYSGIVRTVSE